MRAVGVAPEAVPSVSPPFPKRHGALALLLSGSDNPLQLVRPWPASQIRQTLWRLSRGKFLAKLPPQLVD